MELIKELEFDGYEFLCKHCEYIIRTTEDGIYFDKPGRRYVYLCPVCNRLRTIKKKHLKKTEIYKLTRNGN